MIGGSYIGEIYIAGISDAYFAVSGAVTVPGLEYSSGIDRLHYASFINLFQFSSGINRIHYTTPDEDR